jgi:capsular exopolysaccharide synthesis family protein
MLGSEVGGVALIGSAFQPFAPEKPSLQKNLLMGLVLGGLLAVLYAITAELVDDTIKDESVFREMGLVMFSFIPFVAGKKASVLPREFSGMKRILYNTSRVFRKKALYAAGNGMGESSVTELADPPMPMITDSLSSSFAESFRVLRTAVDYSRVDGSIKSILVSGTAMSEGKSTVCCNLGMAFALAGKKTLVIDGDFRRSSIHKKLNGRRERGLTDYLFGQEQAMDESCFQKTHVDNLVFLSAGKKVPNPNELLGSSKMREFIRCMEGRFDKILIDSPPLFLSDAAQLARAIDGVLLVSRLHFTSRKPLQAFAKDHFLRPLLLGVVQIGSRELKWHGYGKYGYGRYEELGA